MSEQVANVRAASTTGPAPMRLPSANRRCAAIVRMNRENKRNALSGGMLQELTMMVTEAGRDDSVSGIVLTGGRRYFSAGADLAEAVQVKSPATSSPSPRRRRPERAIEENPKPVIAVIHGPCITGGLEVAMACDERIAAQGSTFAMTSSRIGSVAGFGGTQTSPSARRAPRC